MPLDNLTLATFLKAELGFLGVVSKNLQAKSPFLKGDSYFLGFVFQRIKTKS